MESKRIINNFKSRINEVRGNKSIFEVVRDGIKLYNQYFYYKMFKPKTFYFDGKRLKYFYGFYNATWKNERFIEIPIILDALQGVDKKKILEVGNVLSHYIPVEHDVVDKYEKSKEVINEDIIEFKSKKKYDLIVSISTIEHVGWDEPIKDSLKIPKAIKNLKEHLSSEGKMIITFLRGHNPHLDDLLDQGKLEFDNGYYFMRMPKENKWVEVDKEKIGKGILAVCVIGG